MASAKDFTASRVPFLANKSSPSSDKGANSVIEQHRTANKLTPVGLGFMCGFLRVFLNYICVLWVLGVDLGFLCVFWLLRA